MANILDTVQLSGSSYDLKDKNAPSVSAVTQQEYDNLPSSAKTSNTFFVITDAEAGDLTNYYTKSETNTLLDGKQDTLVSSVNIKTINNESILGSGNIDIQGGGGSSYTAGDGIDITNNVISVTGKVDTTTYNTYTAATDTALASKQTTLTAGTGISIVDNVISATGGGGGGKAIEAGRGIAITTGETADTVSFNLPISAGTGTNSIAEGDASNKASGSSSHAEGSNTKANGSYSHAEGFYSTAKGSYSHAEGFGANANGASSHAEGGATNANGDYSHAEGDTTTAKGNYSHAEGNKTITNNQSEHASGQYNNSVSASTTFGDSGNTLFSVGNGTADNARHNAFEIRQNGDIYISSGGTDIKLQDHLGGGGGGTVESAITSGSTNAVESKAIWSATTFNKDVLLTFNGRYSTNYPNGCTKLIVEVAGSTNSSTITFYNDNQNLGNITITNFGSIEVYNSFNGASYEISGTTVIINYPTVTNVTRIEVSSNSDYVYTAVVEGAWVNENTYMKSEVDGIVTSLQNNINSKLDATAYTPTVVDSQLNAASQNPVQNQALYSELRFDNGESETTLTFENGQSTNYPNGCTKLNVEVVGSTNYSYITFYNDNQNLGNITITNFGSIEVTNSFNGASYEISGTTVIITYPTVTSVTKIEADNNGNYVFKAIVASATPLKDQVVANTTALGGLKLVKLSQSEYDALSPNYDSNTLYIIKD